MRIALLGPPGSGKETQSRKLAAHYGLTLLAIADMIRDAAQGSTEAGQLAKPFLDLGQHVPDEVLFAILRERLGREDVRPGFLLAGFPRTTHQADELDVLLDEVGLPLDLVLLLEVDGDLIMERLEGLRICVACGQNYNIYSHPSLVDGICDECGGRLRHRADNNEVTLTNRLKIYEHQTVSLIQYYKLHGKLRRIEAEGGVDEVNRRLCSAIEEAPPAVAETEALEAAPVSIETEVREVAREELPPAENAATAVSAQEAAPQKAPAKKTVPKKVATKKTPAKKSATKKVAVKKTAPKKATVKKGSPKNSPVKKAAPKKAGTNKTAPKKATAKKSTLKKITAKKGVAKKATAKKAAPKKPTVKKSSPKKPAAKKKTAKKTAPKKTIAQKRAPKKTTTKRAAGNKKTARR